uniref:Uncharacterized protein n=1 Tax=Triticum urartu TaxID=4572 RepID=A0A8R7UWZ5_TRIUA
MYVYPYIIQKDTPGVYTAEGRGRAHRIGYSKTPIFCSKRETPACELFGEFLSYNVAMARGISLLCSLIFLWHVDAGFLLVVAGAVAGHGHGREPARPWAGPARAPPLKRLLRRGRRRERSACPVPALHGDEPHQRAARALGAGAADGRRGAGLAATRRGRLLALLVEAAAEGARVVRRGTHAGPTALAGGRGRGGRRRDADGLGRRAGGATGGELDAGGRGGAVAGYGQDRPAGPTGSRRRHVRSESGRPEAEQGCL